MAAVFSPMQQNPKIGSNPTAAGLFTGDRGEPTHTGD